MKITLSMTALALLFVLANCDKKKEEDMASTEATTQEAPAADTSASTEEKAEESKE